MVTLSFSFLTVQVVPVKGCLPKRAPVHHKTPTTAPTRMRLTLPPVRNLRWLLHLLGRGGREETGPSERLIRCCSPFGCGEALPVGCAAMGVAWGVWAGCIVIDPHSSLIKWQAFE